MSTATQTAAPARPRLSSDQVLKIAREDAEQVYRDLSPFQIRISLEKDGWHIDYHVKDASMNGGGPHYIIDQTTGSILSKKYEQ